jgi:hypothetical protein
MIVIHLILTLLDAAFFLGIAGLCIGLVWRVLAALGDAITGPGKQGELDLQRRARREQIERWKHDAHMGRVERNTGPPPPPPPPLSPRARREQVERMRHEAHMGRVP